MYCFGAFTIKNKMGSILAIDYGLKRIGLAISDPDRVFAFPLKVLENKGFNFIVSSINDIIDERSVDLIIIGIPYSINKNKSKMEDIVSDFVKKIEKEIKIPVKTIDEKLSSFSAEENLKERGISARKFKEYVDMEAARLLLNEFLKI